MEILCDLRTFSVCEDPRVVHYSKIPLARTPHLRQVCQKVHVVFRERGQRNNVVAACIRKECGCWLERPLVPECRINKTCQDEQIIVSENTAFSGLMARWQG